MQRMNRSYFFIILCLIITVSLFFWNRFADQRSHIDSHTVREVEVTIILDFALKGNYETVVIGRRGINKAFFMGSVSRYIINRISNRSLWIVT
jgi:hypothetical protein